MTRNGFDRVARAYRWLEYLSFGPWLERCRFHFLPALLERRSALVLGDGDGRFCAQLLRSAPTVEAVAVDGSAAMLRLLLRRCAGGRVRVAQADLAQGLPAELLEEGRSFDLVTTHFLLDCLHPDEVDRLLAQAVAKMSPGGLWLVSEFDVPRGPLRLPAAALVRALYFAFRLSTGLRVHRLPDWRAAMLRHGLHRDEAKHFLGGILVAELWSFRSANSSSGRDERTRIEGDDESLPAATCIGRHTEKQSAAGCSKAAG